MEKFPPSVPHDEAMRDLVKRNPDFGVGMLEGAIDALLSGDIDDSRILFHEYVNATIGFKKLADLTGKNSKSLMKMLGHNGKPTVNNLYDIIRACAKAENLSISAKATRINPESASPEKLRQAS